ncbi:MAG: class II aldolase/adducin family protein [Ruminococcaceae bacterium]|nr:class II aldolase/adducin family protein [Oscillospiraceae bacterium]
MFFEKNAKLLADFTRLSQTAGARADYVQGGGGNTSVKLCDGLMAIKASGYCLKDITPDNAYAVMDAQALRRFYYENEPANLEDVEKQGSTCAKENTKTIEGLPALRPSVEAGFHSILKTFVLHTHSVYANLAACSNQCVELANKAFAGADYTWGWVPYTDPGANLTFAIRDELCRVEKETGKTPSVILMQNHGIIVHDDDADTCLSIHADANERIAAAFGLTGDSFPATAVEEMAAGIYAAAVPYLKAQLQSGVHTQTSLLEEPLYPDQMVFLVDTFFMDAPKLEDGQCVASSKTGNMLMLMPQKKAQTLVETLTAVFFIMENIKKAGYTVSTMGEAAKKFIANWESEKYRKSLAAK